MDPGVSAWQRSAPFRAATQISGMVTLVGQVGGSLAGGGIAWRREFVGQCAFVVRRCAFPIVISACAFIWGVVVILMAGELRELGAVDRLGRGVSMGATREFATWLTGMIVAGIAGTAVCADLGARKVREELDALEVLATNPIRSLVLPRVLAMTLMTPVMYLFTAFVGLLSGAAGLALLHGVPPAAYFANAGTLVYADILGALVKMLLIGAMIGIVFCFKGLNAKGGAEGVGRAVNEAVVVVFVAIFVLNYFFNSFFLGTFPSVGELR